MVVASRTTFAMVMLILTAESGSVGSCPKEYFENPQHGTCLRILDTRCDWHEARKHCADLDSSLVSVDSVDMVQFMADLVLEHGPSNAVDFWLPFNDLWREGDFRSTDGTAMTFSNWYKDTGFRPQPSDINHNQNCVVQNLNSANLGNGSYTWWDKDCTDTSTPVCEWWHGKGARSSEIFKKAEETVDNYNMEIMRSLTAVSKLRCASTCAHDLTCDAFGVNTSQSAKGTCHLMTLKQLDTSTAIAETANKMVGFTLFMSRK